MKKILFIVVIILAVQTAFAQEYLNWTSYQIEGFYVKKELPQGSLDENGNNIRVIFMTTEINNGVYDIEITDANGDFYNIKGTDFYLKFRTYYGYAGYGDKGVLTVSYSMYNSKFYKK